MALSNITFTKGQGGLARPLPGLDHVSGIVFYSNTLPAGYGTDKMKQITSLADAEAKGITSAVAALKVLHYHIKWFFKKSPGATLYVGVFPVPETTYDFDEIRELQEFAEGTIRQVGVYVSSVTYNTSQVIAIQSIVTALEVANTPLSVIYTPDIHSVADLTTLGDLRVLSAQKVSVDIGQDGGADGLALFDAIGKSIGSLGALLGTIASAQVHLNIGWVDKFNIADVEFDVPAFSNGALVKDNLSKTDDLDTKGYIFLRKHVGISGTYFNDSHTAIAATSDYAYIEANRTIDKAIRGVRSYLLPQLNGPVRIDASTGKLPNDFATYLETLGDRALAEMERNGELSGYATIIDPDQDVLSTSQISVEIALVPIGVSRTIVVKIGFTTKIA